MSTRLSLDAVRVVGFVETANSVLAQVAHPPDSLVSNKPEELRLSLDAVRVVGFIKTANSVLAQVAHPPDSLVSNKPEELHNQAEPGRCSRCRFYRN